MSTTTGFFRDADGVEFCFKDPSAILPYHLDFERWLETVDGEVLTSATFTVETAGITKLSESFTDTRATIELSGGTAGEDYVVRCNFTTATRTDVRRFRVKVRPR